MRRWARFGGFRRFVNKSEVPRAHKRLDFWNKVAEVGGTGYSWSGTVGRTKVGTKVGKFRDAVSLKVHKVRTSLIGDF